MKNMEFWEDLKQQNVRAKDLNFSAFTYLKDTKKW